MLSYSIPNLEDQDAAITIALAATTGVYVIIICSVLYVYKMCVVIQNTSNITAYMI